MPDLEYNTVKVDRYYRILLRQSLVRQLPWLKGEGAIEAWLLVGNSSRCRLLSSYEVKNDSRLRELRARIEAEVNLTSTDALEFHDESLVALPLRLLPIQVTPPDPGWRLTLPRPVAAVMKITPGVSEVAAILLRGHVELWTIELLASAMSTPLADLI